MLIPKVNIHNVHLLENPMKSTAYPLLPPPGTLKATEYFTIILLFVRRRANKQQRGTNITWPINILGMSAAFLWTLRRKGHQEIGFDLNGLLRLQVRRYRSQYRGRMPPACSSSMA